MALQAAGSLWAAKGTASSWSTHLGGQWAASVEAVRRGFVLFACSFVPGAQSQVWLGQGPSGVFWGFFCRTGL